MQKGIVLMVSLYSSSDISSLSRRKKVCLRLSLILSVLTVTVCTAICFFVRTSNAGKLQLAVTVFFTLGGWAVILLLRLGYFPAKAAEAHCAGILSAEPAELCGILRLTGQRIRVPKSILVQHAVLHTENEEILLSVEDSRAALLPACDAPVRITVVRKFITSFEVPCEENP